MKTLKELKNAVENTATVFQNYYLDYLNNFITSKAYAEYYGISTGEALKRINIGKKIHSQRTEKLT